MKILRVGDMHVKPNNIQESEALMMFIVYKADELKIDRLELLGDLFDTHSILRLEVLEFWDKTFSELLYKRPYNTVVLVGNHDMTGSYNNTYSSLTPFKNFDGIQIVDEPHQDGLYGYLPYIHDNEKFIEEANKLAAQGATVLVAHPNYEGAVYDNNQPISNGVVPDRLSSTFRHLIGGHIHTETSYGRVWYLGTPRWLTKSCSNKQKGIWLCTHDDITGEMLSKEFISTENVCTPIRSLVWKEGQDRPEIPTNAKVDIELIGGSDWVQKMKKELAGTVSISSKITDTKKTKERKSGSSLHEFLSKYYQGDEVKRQKLIKFLGDLNLV